MVRHRSIHQSHRSDPMGKCERTLRANLRVRFWALKYLLGSTSIQKELFDYTWLHSKKKNTHEDLEKQIIYCIVYTKLKMQLPNPDKAFIEPVFVLVGSISMVCISQAMLNFNHRFFQTQAFGTMFGFSNSWAIEGTKILRGPFQRRFLSVSYIL